MTLLFIIFSAVVSFIVPEAGQDIILAINSQLHTDMSGGVIFIFGWIIAIILDSVTRSN